MEKDARQRNIGAVRAWLYYKGPKIGITVALKPNFWITVTFDHYVICEWVLEGNSNTTSGLCLWVGTIYLNFLDQMFYVLHVYIL